MVFLRLPWQATRAHRLFQRTGIATIIVQQDEDTYELVGGMIAGLHRRGAKADYVLKRFNFATNCQANPKFLTT
ncbi:MAG: hypothetical protein HC812_17215 [Leptolyngbya sp. RL_3_1]|nr:hypothetical protein [Leptolyngbya sp. RL_3_1]